MAKHFCPNGHLAVVRHDPDSDGLLGMCDMCGWSAAYVVARDQGDYASKDGVLANREREQIPEPPAQPALAAGGSSRRGSDR